MESNKSRLLAAILAYLLGMFGADLFYLNKKQQAIWQLVLTLSIFPCMILMMICAFLSWLIVPILFMFLFGMIALAAMLAGMIWWIVRFIKILAGEETDDQGNKVTSWEIK
ncbi:MAG: hypothetical protein IIW17_04840 [Clostridia bacterium]|nr:hypothetical protein [Clostridia bacterium]MBQ5793326.1 hypothetical protein [Clostridia bacterium]